MDYNSTPPCKTVRVYAATKTALDIRGFYLFVCQEIADQDCQFKVTALVAEQKLGQTSANHQRPSQQNIPVPLLSMECPILAG